MTDTEAMFALWDDDEIVGFIRKQKDNKTLDYEVWCACRVLGKGLLRKYKLLAIAKKAGVGV